MNRLREVLVVAAILLAALPVAAQTEQTAEPTKALKQLSLEELFDLEVTSVSQKPEPVSKTAAAVHVVTADDLRRMGAVSIPEALRYIPGVEVARVNSRSYAITARGFNGTAANKLLVLMDGRSIYTPLYSGVFWDVQDAFIEDIEQIEVIRGPGATVWGANAVNGVINIISKSAASTQGFLVTGGAGNRERGFGGARYGGSIGPNAFFRVYGKDYDRGPSLLPDGDEAGDASRMWQGGFRTDWTPTPANGFTAQGDIYGSSIDQRSSDRSQMSGGNALANWTKRFSDRSTLKIQAYYDRTKRDIPSVFGETLDSYDLTLSHRFAPGRRHDLVWGLGYRLTSDDVRNSAGLAFLPPRLTHRLYTGFVQDELTLSANRLFLTVGSKVEHNDYTDFEYQPGAHLAWTPTPTQTVWGAVSRAVRAPSRIDRDLFAPSQPPYFLVGDSSFVSEVLLAFELGYKAQPTSELTASVSTFYNTYDKLRSLEMASLPLSLGNGLEGRTYGVEAEGACQLARNWRLSAGYTFLRLILDVDPTSTDTQQERQEGDSPRHQAFVRSSLKLPRGVTLDASARYVDRLPNQNVPGNTVCDARLAWQPSKTAEIAVVGQGLFDSRHPEFGMPSTRREVGRSIYGKLSCWF
ncbi:MAG TPA: TonB-dependent receptor [Candidatus Eisenbacteria bacterium]|nr:TonB-dependent receptor [Candidatus Eisenbacteria bacterium]